MAHPGGPPKKSFLDAAKTSLPPKQDKPVDKAAEAPAKAVAPQPKAVPKPATKTLPASSSKTSVKPCFSTFKERGYPMGFKDKEEFESCMQDLCNTAQEQGIACKTVGVRGSAATYTSSSPHKKGQHFDSRGKGKSDIDAFIVTDTPLDSWPNKYGFFHPLDVAEEFPELAEWGEGWGKKLGREITPAVHKSWAPALKEPYIAYACDC
jgi:hypothetical protein